jgi:hypothetical protein
LLYPFVPGGIVMAEPVYTAAAKLMRMDRRALSIAVRPLG